MENVKEIPTIEEALINFFRTESEKRNETFTEENAKEVRTNDVFSPLKQFCIDFAKLHVEAALKSAVNKSEAIPLSQGAVGQFGVDIDSILTAYPLENIK